MDNAVHASRHIPFNSVVHNNVRLCHSSQADYNPNANTNTNTNTNASTNADTYPNARANARLVTL
jgi:hypothetical protein